MQKWFQFVPGTPAVLDIAEAHPDKPRQQGVVFMPDAGLATRNQSLAETIDAAFEGRDAVGPSTTGAVREAVENALDLLDHGAARVAEKAADGSWRVNQWLKKAVLLSFRLNDMSVIPGGPGGAAWWDKVPSKFKGWDDKSFRAAGFRAVPGCVVRRSAYIAPGVVLMPSFVNLGAYVDRGTMIDTWATVGSCAQIGKNCHVSGGAGIGGVLEPLQAGPVIVEDNCFIGARSEVAEGVIVREGAVLSMGVFLGASTKIVDRDSGEIFVGEVPPYAVVVPGSLPSKPRANGEAGPSLACAVIVKRVDAKTRAKTDINELLRD
jgi:2,3,4,5-tetrahydropyridine-2-carboxylate N-succinyltransferase